MVKSAATLADHVIVTIHAHEGGRTRLEPAEFLVTFARAMIDAGADVFVGHGPHVLRGIEIYKGAPILYSLGDFIFQNETLLRYPADNYDDQRLGPDAQPNDYLNRRYDFDKSGFPADPPIWESVVAMPRFRDGRLAELALHPISLGFGGARHVRGRPMLAPPRAGHEDPRRPDHAVGAVRDAHQRARRRRLRASCNRTSSPRQQEPRHRSRRLDVERRQLRHCWRLEVLPYGRTVARQRGGRAGTTVQSPPCSARRAPMFAVVVDRAVRRRLRFPGAGPGARRRPPRLRPPAPPRGPSMSSSPTAASWTAPARRGSAADVGIVGDRIAAIGNLSRATAATRIDAAGQVVAPGFIDLLGQSEFNVLVDSRAASKITQGITTEITGEGVSIAPVNDQMMADRKAELRLLQGGAGLAHARPSTSRGSSGRPRR